MRLIDADKLLDTEINMKFTDGKFYVESAEIYKLIDEQPTAYDIDKVIEELENLVKVVYKGIDGNIHLRYSMETILKAIEIVKGGEK